MFQGNRHQHVFNRLHGGVGLSKDLEISKHAVRIILTQSLQVDFLLAFEGVVKALPTNAHRQAQVVRRCRTEALLAKDAQRGPQGFVALKFLRACHLHKGKALWIVLSRMKYQRGARRTVTDSLPKKRMTANRIFITGSPLSSAASVQRTCTHPTTSRAL